MVKRYVKTVEEQLRNAVCNQERDWDDRIHIFLLAYRAATNETAGVTPAKMVFVRETRLTCRLMFGAHQTENSRQ
jgi:hypothetical protein